MLAISLRVSPCRLRARRGAARRWTSAVLPSIETDTSGSMVRVSVALGPSTRIVPSATCSFTLSGMAMAMRPIRDMRVLSSPDLADDLAAHALPARLAIGQDAARRGEDA